MKPDPLKTIAFALGGAGVAKLLRAKPVMANFEKWGYPSWARPAVGAIEIGIAAAALAGYNDPPSRFVAGVGTLCTMAGAAATHKRAGDPVFEYIPVLALTAAGVAALAGPGKPSSTT